MNESYEDFLVRLDGLREVAAARALAERHGLNAESVRKMIRAEVDDRERDAARTPGRPRPRRGASEREAARSLADWLEKGDEWVVGLDFSDIADFVLGHRQACVWAVLTTKARAARRAP